MEGTVLSRDQTRDAGNIITESLENKCWDCVRWSREWLDRQKDQALSPRAFNIKRFGREGTSKRKWEIAGSEQQVESQKRGEMELEAVNADNSFKDYYFKVAERNGQELAREWDYENKYSRC